MKPSADLQRMLATLVAEAEQHTRARGGRSITRADLDAAHAAREDTSLRRWLQRERGMCSDPYCDAPIAGWCDTCDAGGPFKAPKWCEAHLRAHLAAHRGHVPYWRYDHDGGAA